MSAVTPLDIIDIVCAEWSISPPELKSILRQRYKGGVPPPATLARECVIALTRRHTETRTSVLMTVLAMTRIGDTMVTIENRFWSRVEKDDGLQRRVARIESRIDDLHDSRMDDILDRAQAAARLINASDITEQQSARLLNVSVDTIKLVMPGGRIVRERGQSERRCRAG